MDEKEDKPPKIDGVNHFGMVCEMGKFGLVMIDPEKPPVIEEEKEIGSI